MTTYATNNPIGSMDPKDLFDNAQNLDFALNSITQVLWKDRLGKDRRSWYGIEKLAENAITSLGYITLDSFQAGATLTRPNQVLRNLPTMEYFRWDGAFPVGGKVVPPGSTPTPQGPGGWVSVGDGALRNNLASPGGAALVGVGPGKTQAQLNAELSSQIAQASGNGVVTDFGYWGLSANNTTPAAGEFSCPTGYLATSTSVTFHQTDKNGRDLDGIIALLQPGSVLLAYGKINSAKRTVMKVVSVTTTSTSVTVTYSIISHAGANVSVGEEYKFIFAIPSSAVGYVPQAPATGGPYVQNGGLWEKIKSYELGRAMFTVTGSSFSYKKNPDNSLLVSWSQLRLYSGLPGVTGVQDATNVSVPVGQALYIDLDSAIPYAVQSAAIDSVVVNAVYGRIIILVGNYQAGFAFGVLAQRLLTASNNKNTRRIVSGTITSSTLSGANYTITTGIGRSFIEQNNGSHEYEIAPVTDVEVAPGHGLVVDFTNGSKNSSNQYIPVVEAIASNSTAGWMSADKYILFGTTGKSGATFGAYRFASAGGAVADDTKIVIQRSSPTFMNIIMKTTQNGSDKYIRYHMDRRENLDTRSDVWRINTVHEVIRAFGEFGFATGTEICSSGEFECAIMETGKTDYMGGWRHGDDQAVLVTMFADGKVLDPAYIGNFKCSRFEVIQKSELLEVDNPVRNVRATAYRRWVFEDGKMELFSHVVFAAAINLKIAFFNMFPIHRLAPDNTTLVTGTAYRSPLYEPEDVSTVGFPITYTKSNIIKYSGPNGWGAEVEVVEGWDKPNRNTWIQNADEYNKGYFDYTGENYDVAAGDSLSGRAVYRIFDAN